jgi:UDP-glucuronate 4-epimerase
LKVLVTGAAGFIGMHLTKRLIAQGDEVFGVDNLNDYYDPSLKKARLDQLTPLQGFGFEKMDIADRDGMARLFKQHRFDAVVNLAAQAGVRYSLTNPHAYIDANVVGFMNVLEGCRHGGVKHLVYASSSSVYGGNTQMPFSEHQGVDHPVSLYAATKKANELMAHTYSHLYRLPTTGLRFFTVYGPWGRPDMALFLFTKAMLEGRAIDVFNHGRMQRDFTYIDDIVSGIVGVIGRPAEPNAVFNASQPDPATSHAPFRIFNIGNQGPVELMEFVSAIEAALGTTAIKNMMPLQPGDVPATFADVSELTAWTGVNPGMPIREGVSRFVHWYRQYHGV